MKKFSRLGFFTLTMAITILSILPAAQALDFKVSGQVNRAVLWGDNGNDNDTKFVDNENSSTRFRFTGSNTFNEVWKVGFKWENQMESNSSVDANMDIGNNTDTGGITFTERHMDIYVEHSKFGKLSLGQGDTASNSTSEVDLSGTTVIAYSSISDRAELGRIIANAVAAAEPVEVAEDAADTCCSAACTQYRIIVRIAEGKSTGQVGN